MPSERSLRASDLPYQVVREHIRREGVAILVTGSTEGHGALLPLGTDTFIAEAIALEVAKLCDGLVFPPFWFTYSGGTRPFPGTVSLPGNVQMEYTRAVIHNLIANGYRHILHLQWHAPYYVNQQLTREIFEETGVPVAFFGLMQLPVMSSEAAAKLISEESFTRETTLTAGALLLLGLSHLLASDSFQADQEVAGRPEDSCLGAIGKAGGTVGHYYTDPTQHLPVRRKADAEAGRRMILLMAKEVAGAVENLRRYASILKDRSSADGTRPVR